MKHGTVCGGVTAVLIGFSLGAFAEVKDNPYQIIIDRNPFALKPIPPPPAPASETNSAPPPPPVEVKLTGITTLLGPPKAFFEFVNTQSKKTERSSGMLVGEKQNEIEVLGIDADKGLVRIRNGDAETTLDFEHNGIKPGGGAGAPAPGAPNPGVVPFNPVPSPIPAPAATAMNNNNPGSRGFVAGGAAPAVNPGMNPNGVVPPGYAGGGIPARPMRADFGNNVIVAGPGGQAGVPQQPQPTVATPTLSREDAEARIEAQRRILEQKEASGQAPAGMSRILPPTRFSPPPVPPAQ